MWTDQVLMCRPDFFNVTYNINPWMNGPPLEPKDHSECVQQWTNLHHTIIRHGGFVRYLEPVDKLPDLVFTANGGLVHKNKAVIPRFANPERMKEERYYREWFQKSGYEILDLGLDSDRFEGNGDAFVFNNTLFMGVGSRTTSSVSIRILDFLGLKKLILCELVDPHFYHLDTCFCPLNGNHVMWYSKAFSAESQHALRGENIVLLDITEKEAMSFACNSVVLGNNVIMPEGCPDTALLLSPHGYNVHHVAMSQFMRAGGAAKCLTLKV